MTYDLHFSAAHKYDSGVEGITIPTVLKSGAERIDLLAKIDTGASFCLFDREYADALGLAVEEGVRRTFSTLNGTFEAYGHYISIQVLGIEHTAEVYFYAHPGTARNLLGRRGWLDRVRVGLVDYDQMVYAAAYDDDAD